MYYYNSNDLMFSISEPGQLRIYVYYLTLLNFTFALSAEKRQIGTSADPTQHTFSMVLLSDGVPVEGSNQQIILSDMEQVYIDQIATQVCLYSI